MLVTANGKSLFVEQTGEGPAVVLVHGLGSSTNCYEPQISTLAPEHTVIRLDLEGAGRSPLVGKPSIDTWAADIESVLDLLALDQVDLVGHSLGTLVCAQFAASRAARVRRLALLAPVRAQPTHLKELTRARASRARTEGMDAVAAGVISATICAKTAAENPAVVAYVRETLYGQDPEGYAASCEALASASDPDYGAVRAPTLMLVGSEDKLATAETAEQLSQEFIDASVEICAGVSHWLTIEAPDEVSAKLRRLFQHDT